MAALLVRSLKNVTSICSSWTNWNLNKIPRRFAIMWTDHRMQRDANNRKIVQEFAAEKLRINAMRKNKILPKQIQEYADREIAALPRRSHVSYLYGRCVLTSRARGKVKPWRMSRIAWRHLADHNNLSGIQRAIW